MKRFVKFTSLLLAILTVMPCIPVFAADLGESVSLVENGLAAHYDASNNTGDGHDATAEVLADLAGENDIASLCPRAFPSPRMPCAFPQHR